MTPNLAVAPDVNRCISVSQVLYFIASRFTPVNHKTLGGDSMYFMVSSMTANRLFGKALRRAVPKLKEVETKLVEACSPQAFDGVIISLVDQPPGYFAEIPNTDRICHVEVGYEHDLRYRWDDSERALQQCLQGVRTALSHIAFTGNAKDRMLNVFEQWVIAQAPPN